MARKEQDEIDYAAEVRTFFAEREGAERENRADMVKDLEFVYVPGAQWDEDARARRRGRPCYSYNRVAGAVNQAIGEQRMTRPSGKVRAQNKADAAPTAEIISGLIRDIEASSGAEAIYDEAFKYAVAGAWGAWRIVPEYADDESFDQVLRIKRIANPLTVYWDEHADPFGRGAKRCVVAERISLDTYKALYGDDEWTSVQVAGDSNGWVTDKDVRIAEYYRMDCREREIALLEDGRVFEYGKALEAELARMASAGLPAPAIKARRKVKQWYCTWVKVDGKRVLDGPIEYAYKHIPVIRLPGRYVNIEGKQYFQSLIRHAKDAQRTYNYDRSNMVETVALTPRAPYIGTAKMFKAHEDQWATANVSNRPYLVYDPDPMAPQAKPERQEGPALPAAYMALAAHDAEDIKQTTGYINPALDMPDGQSPESGRAIRARLQIGDSGAYEFLDNFAKAVQFTWEIAVDMLPVHYDTERVERIMGIDGRESFVTITPDMWRNAKYDVTVTLGPAYATARMEALDTLLEASERIPAVAELAPDIVVKNLDVQGADEIERRIRRRMIVAGQIEPTEEEEKAGITPPPPDPMQVALAERLKAQTEKERAAAVKTQVETAVTMAEADAAPRREQLELTQLLADIVHQQAETRLLIKQLLEKGPDKSTLFAAV